MKIHDPKTFSFSGARAALFLAFLSVLLSAALPLLAQDSHPGPMAPPPPDKAVRRVGNTVDPDAPLPAAPEEIIRKFTEKEERYVEARTHFWYRKSVRLQEFSGDGKPAGQIEITTEPAVTADGKPYSRIVGQPVSTLKSLQLAPEDLESLALIMAYPVTASLRPKYDLRYAGKEQLDEISCYVFQVHPKAVERTRPYFDGILWVDDKYLEVVKTYGKWVTDLGPVHSPTLPFTLFETYRENVEGKYWFPNYASSDDVLHFQSGDVPIRLIIKWTDYKRVSPPAPERPAAAPPPPPAKPKP